MWSAAQMLLLCYLSLKIHQVPYKLLVNKGVNVKTKHLSLHKCSVLNVLLSYTAKKKEYR